MEEGQQQKIQQFLTFKEYNIPWRISYEYYFKDGVYHWIYAWIKIGWFPSGEFELSPYVMDNKDVIDDRDVICGVVSGNSKAIVDKILRKAPFINIMFSNKNGYLRIEDFAYDDVKDSEAIFAIAQVELGSPTHFPGII